jgi:hypothetical protein
VMQQLSADPKRPPLDQAVPRNLDPLPTADVAAYISRRFKQTGRRRRRTDAAAGVHPRTSAAKHDAGALPLGANARRDEGTG